jgi:Secretion system C-terminal sorting domain/PKD domain
VSTTVTGLVQGVYQFELTVTDNNGATDKDTMQVTVNAAPNVPPTADAGVDQTITLPTNNSTIDGSASSDPDGTITTYAWVKISGPGAGLITNPGQATTTVTGLVQGVYQFELTVTDNNGATDKDTMQVTVNAAPNVPPTANAGVDQTITLPTNNTTIDGSASSDPDGTITTYAWVKISGPGAGVITNPSSASTTVTGLAQGVYQFELTVTDNNGATDKDTMQVTVNAAPNVPPTANAGIDQTITLPTNNTTIDGSASSDPDGTITTFAWVKISGPGAGAITNPSNVTTTVTGMVQGVYQFELTVTDNNGATDKDTMQVTVNAAPNEPPIANAGVDQTITLPTNNTTIDGSASSDPDGTITNYAWVKISGPGAGVITNPSSVSTTVTGLVQGIYLFELTVTDNNGATDKDTMQVTVNAAPNIPPNADAGNDQTITLPTNITIISGSASTDPDGTITAYAWLKISGPAAGAISNPSSVTTSVTGLIQGVYKFELTVTDNNGATDKDTMQVTVNAAPNVPPTANAGVDQTITLPTNNTTIDGSASFDPDGTITTYAWVKIAGPVSGSITNPSSVTTSVTGLVQGLYSFELTVTDNNGATDKDTMQVRVNIAPNIHPIARAGNDQSITYPTTISILDGSASVDPDGTITTYAWLKISGPIQGIVANPSQAKTAIIGLIQGVYLFELTVTDNSGATGKDTVSVEVTGTIEPAVRLYPNPATSIINIEILAASNENRTTIIIRDLRGAVIYKEDFARIQPLITRQIDMSRFANGYYIVEVIEDNVQMAALKFIKQ